MLILSLPVTLENLKAATNVEVNVLQLLDEACAAAATSKTDLSSSVLQADRTTQLVVDLGFSFLLSTFCTRRVDLRP